MMTQISDSCATIWTATARLGVDLPEAIRDGSCAAAELSDMMSRCGDCWHQRKCARWLQATRGTVAREMPGFCESASTLNAIKARARPLSLHA